MEGNYIIVDFNSLCINTDKNKRVFGKGKTKELSIL